MITENTIETTKLNELLRYYLKDTKNNISIYIIILNTSNFIMKNEVEVTHVTLNDEKGYDFHSNKKKKTIHGYRNLVHHIYMITLLFIYIKEKLIIIYELLDFCNLLPSKVVSSYNYTKHISSIKECIKKIKLLKIFSFYLLLIISMDGSCLLFYH